MSSDLKYTSMIFAIYRYSHPSLFTFYTWAVKTQINPEEVTFSRSLRINTGKSGKLLTLNLVVNH